ncbi:hypothetical protein LWC34_45205 [Kibdelosporangium philippinense]|uniref:DUF3039 domain-containing protein n=2 Tax=Kibdelosporangium philippinense TaxID=211113 RepID=A0ABS8ZRV8_9PSEU|nr:hypothetical protein [Kibdelosporangium philippinense]MCE7009958.1 hypothetical protein [Kibdelosporangium philippinense]
MTTDLPSDIPLFWGRGIIEPNCAHVRETRTGQPVTDLAEDGSIMGFAICGCLLIADVTDEQVTSGVHRRCSRCMELLANRKPGVDYPLWTPE